MRKKRQFTIVAVLVMAAIGAIVWASTNWAKEPNLTIRQLAMSNGRYSGEQVKVTGYANVKDQDVWDAKTSTLHFVVTDPKGNDAVSVAFPGPKPDNFAKGSKVLVTGLVENDGRLQASQVETFCPDHYQGNYSNNNNKIN